MLALAAREGLQSAAALVYLEASEHYKQRNLLEGGMYSFADLDAEDEQVLMQGVQLEAQQAAGTAAGAAAADAAADAAAGAADAAGGAAAPADSSAAAAGGVQAAPQVALDGGLSDEAATLHPPLATFLSNTFGFTAGQSSETACTCWPHLAGLRVVECWAVACWHGVRLGLHALQRPSQPTPILPAPAAALHTPAAWSPTRRHISLTFAPTVPPLCRCSGPHGCAAVGHSAFRGDLAGQQVW